LPYAVLSGFSVVKYIRVVGTHNTVNKVFHVVTLEALYTMSVYQLDMGLIVPSSNVATLDHSALVIEGKYHRLYARGNFCCCL